jgi:2-keto-4-pentenoate hydratase/2-oxohepta-3-ene-1,7-dioic acid hydratase in catechol pathway
VKLATFEVETPVGRRRRVGVVEDEGEDGSEGEGTPLVDVTSAYAAALADDGEAAPLEIARAHAPPDMLDLLRRGERGTAAVGIAREFAAREPDAEGPDGGRLRFDTDEDGVRLLAPLPRPNSLRDFMAFEEHVRNALGEPADVWFDQPVYYKSNPDSVVGPEETVRWPAYSEIMDYELEIAAVIGKRGTDVPVEEAEGYIAGYTVFNDFSARDAQGTEMEGRLGPAKGKDFANALGPYLVTVDSFDPAMATMRAEVDGEVWSEGSPGEMYHSFADIVAHVSRSETLHPGDVLGSGTIGEGCGLELGRFLESGDTVSLSAEGIGTLSNRVVSHDAD